MFLIDPSGDQVKYMVHLEFKATNNMAEYEALIFGLSSALSLGICQHQVKGDSQLIIKQVRGECSCNADLWLVVGPIVGDLPTPGEGRLPADHQASPRGV